MTDACVSGEWLEGQVMFLLLLVFLVVGSFAMAFCCALVVLAARFVCRIFAGLCGFNGHKPREAEDA